MSDTLPAGNASRHQMLIERAARPIVQAANPPGLSARPIRALPYRHLVSMVLTANGNGQVSTQLPSDAKFELHYIIGNSSLDSTANYSPNFFEVLVTEQSTSRQLSNVRIPQNLLSPLPGDALFEHRPITFDRQTNLQLDALNYAGVSLTIRVVFVGYKIYEN